LRNPITQDKMERAILAELREIKDRLSPDPGPAFIDRDVLSKATAVTAFSKKVDGGLEIDGKDFSQYIIQTDGNIGDVSYRIKNLRGEFTTEFEASRLPYVPGPVDLIQFKNDRAESGKSIFVTKMKVTNLSAAPPPLPAEEVDPLIILHEEIQKPYTATKETGIVPFSANTRITGVNTIMTLESPAGTDFSVGASQTAIITRILYTSSVAGVFVQIGYGDDGVAEGTTDPTNPVFVFGEGGAGETPLIVTTADTPLVGIVALEIPAGKFPFVEVPATNAFKPVHVFGYLRDA